MTSYLVAMTSDCRHGWRNDGNAEQLKEEDQAQDRFEKNSQAKQKKSSTTKSR